MRDPASHDAICSHLECDPGRRHHSLEMHSVCIASDMPRIHTAFGRIRLGSRIIRTGLDVELADERMTPPWFSDPRWTLSPNRYKRHLLNTTGHREYADAEITIVRYRCEMEPAIIPLTKGEFDTGTLIGSHRPA